MIVAHCTGSADLHQVHDESEARRVLSAHGSTAANLPKAIREITALHFSRAEAAWAIYGFDPSKQEHQDQLDVLLGI